MTESDAELVRRSVDGDLAAFETLITRYERSVRSVARRFSRMCTPAKTPHRRSSWKPFGRSINSANAIDLALAHADRPARFGKTARPARANADSERLLRTGGASLRRSRAAQSEFLLSAIERLPEQERLVVTMCYFDGHKTQEIADATGIPLGTVTKQLSRAYERLRQWLVTSEEINHE